MHWGRIRRMALSLAMLVVATPAFSQSVNVISQFGTGGIDSVNAVASNSTGVFVAGTTGSAALIGADPTGNPLVHAGGTDVFVRKYNPDGTIAWTWQFGSAVNDEALGIAADANGVYVVGSTQGDLFGSNAGGRDAFIRKFNNAGVPLWDRQFGSDGNDSAKAVAVDAGGVTVAGSTSGAFPGQTSAGSQDGFAIRYALDPLPADAPLWVSQFGAPGFDDATGVAAESGGIYIAGWTNGTIAGTSAGGTDIYLRRYDAAGNHSWTLQAGGASGDLATAVAADSTGVYIVGSSSGSYIGSSTPDPDAFIVKYSLAGSSVLWGPVRIGTSAIDEFKGVASDGSAVYAVGSSSGSLQGTNAGLTDLIAVKWNTSGAEQWRLQLGSAAGEDANGVSAHASGIYVGGRTQGSLLGANAGSYDAFLARITQTTSSGATIADLIALVKSYNLKSGIENSLDAKLDAAAKAYDAAVSGDRYTACNQLGAFINAVQAQTGKAITQAQADALLAMTLQIKTSLGCPQ